MPLPLLRAIAVSILIAVAIPFLFAVYWLWFYLDYPGLFGIPGQVIFFGLIATIQGIRSIGMRDWIRSFGAIGVVMGSVLTILALHPSSACGAVTGDACTVDLDPSQLLLPSLGLLILSVFADVSTPVKQMVN